MNHRNGSQCEFTSSPILRQMVHHGEASWGACYTQSNELTQTGKKEKIMTPHNAIILFFLFSNLCPYDAYFYTLVLLEKTYFYFLLFHFKLLIFLPRSPLLCISTCIKFSCIHGSFSYCFTFRLLPICSAAKAVGISSLEQAAASQTLQGSCGIRPSWLVRFSLSEILEFWIPQSWTVHSGIIQNSPKLETILMSFSG